MRSPERLRPFLLVLAATCSIALLGSVAEAASGDPVIEFNRDIRPMLADNCFACHGPDKNQRKADLRLDREEGALADRGGYQPLAPGKPETSALYRRILGADGKQRMPPAKTGKALTKRQIELLRLWIEQGGKWQKHWSLIPPRRPPSPQVHHSSWPINPIDKFIVARQEQEGLQPAPAGRSAHAGSPSVVRPDRATADPGASGGLSGRPVARCLRAAG